MLSRLLNTKPVQPYMNARATSSMALLQPGPNLLNFKPGVSLPRWRAARDAQLRGKRAAIIGCIGNSTTRGIGAGDAASQNTNAMLHSYPQQLADSLTTLGLNAVHDNVLGGGGGGTNTELSWEAVTNGDVTGTFAQSGMYLGGDAVVLGQTDTTTTISFTTKQACDTIELWFSSIVATAQNIQYSIDGGALVPVAVASAHTYGASGIGIKGEVITGLSNTTHTIVVSRPVSGTFRVDVIGYNAYNSTAMTTRVLNLGASGFRISNYTLSSQPYHAMGSNGALRHLRTMGVDLWIVKFRLNEEGADGSGATSPSAYGGDLMTLIPFLMVSGDVLLMSEHQSGLAALSANVTQGLWMKSKEIAQALNIPYYDEYQEWGTFSRISALGYEDDPVNVHPNRLFYGAQAASLAHLLMT